MSDRELMVKEPSMMDLLQIAVDKGAGIETLERLVALKERMMDRQAAIDFDTALNSCQKQIGRIAPNVQRKDTNSWWADYSQLDRTIRPIYTEAGFSVGFSEVAPVAIGKVRIKGTLSREGISRDYFSEITPSTTGPKGGAMATATDADAIAASRAKRYIMLSIFNIATGIDRQEKEGIPAAEREFMADTTVDEWIDAMNNAPDMNALKSVFSECWGKAKKLNDTDAKNAFQKTYEAKKRSLL